MNSIERNAAENAKDWEAFQRAREIGIINKKIKEYEEWLESDDLEKRDMARQILKHLYYVQARNREQSGQTR